MRNVPVPDSGRRMPWLVRNLSLFERLRIVELARPALRALRPRAATGLTAGELADLSGKVFEELARLAEQHGAALVLIDLPTYADYENPNELWRERIAREARKRDIAFIDLVEELRGLPRSDVARLYEPIDVGDLRGSETAVQRGGPRVGGRGGPRATCTSLPARRRARSAPRAPDAAPLPCRDRERHMSESFDLLIRGGTLVDGTRRARRARATSAIRGGRIAALGDVRGQRRAHARRERLRRRAGLRRHPHPLRRAGLLGPHALDLALARRHERRDRQLRLRHRADAAGSTAT